MRWDAGGGGGEGVAVIADIAVIAGIGNANLTTDQHDDTDQQGHRRGRRCHMSMAGHGEGEAKI
jgi:hypothetical protein